MKNDEATCEEDPFEDYITSCQACTLPSIISRRGKETFFYEEKSNGQGDFTSKELNFLELSKYNSLIIEENCLRSSKEDSNDIIHEIYHVFDSNGQQVFDEKAITDIMKHWLGMKLMGLKMKKERDGYVRIAEFSTDTKKYN